MNAHHIGPQQPTAAPQQEADTRLHNQPAPDIVSSTPSTSFTPSSHHPAPPTHKVQLPQADSAYGVDPVTGAQASQDDLAAVADSFQQPPDSSSAERRPAVPQTAPTSSGTGRAQQQSGPSDSAPTDITAFASELATRANVDDQSQGSTQQLRQAAQDADAGSAHPPSTSQQQQQQQAAGPSDIHASYQHKDFVPSTSHQPSTAAAQPSSMPVQGSEVHASYQHKDFTPGDLPSQLQPHTDSTAYPASAESASQQHSSELSESDAKLGPGFESEKRSVSQQEPSSKSQDSQPQQTLLQMVPPGAASQAEGQQENQLTALASASPSGQEETDHAAVDVSQDGAVSSGQPASEITAGAQPRPAAADRARQDSDAHTAGSGTAGSSNVQTEQAGTAGRGEQGYGQILHDMLLNEC